jgi:hypothetical protein
MSPMLPTTRSRASNAVATSALHGGGKGRSGSGKEGGSGGGQGSKGRSGGGTELFAAGTCQCILLHVLHCASAYCAHSPTIHYRTGTVMTPITPISLV